MLPTDGGGYATSYEDEATAAEPPDSMSDAMGGGAATEPEPTPVDTAANERSPATVAPAIGRDEATGQGAQRDTIGYGLLDCPEVALVGDPFTLMVGLSPVPTAASGTAEIQKPPGVGTEFLLSIQIHVDPDAFAILEGGDWSFDIPITEREPYPKRDLRLAALGARAGKAGSIQAIFAIEGQAVAWLTRAVAVIDHVSQTPAAVEPPISALVAIPMSKVPADLTITVLEPDVPGNLVWGILAPPGSGIAIPAADEMRTRIGSDARTFALKFIDRVPRLGHRKLFEGVCGFGKEIAAQMPVPVLTAIDKVIAHARAENRMATVLLVSHEPYIPWELALIEEPSPRGPSPFLGGQAAVGRWVLGERVDNEGHRKPPLPPPPAVTVRSMAVVSGRYQRENWPDLPAARREARDLISTYKAKAVEATEGAVMGLLRGRPSAQLLHFAIHGQFNPDGTEEGMILVDGQLEPTTVLGTPLSGTPFVFLNACQLGAAEQLLGDYAGMASSLLQQGAAGVIAPLWIVRDTIAREIAMEFYVAAFNGIPAGEILRRVRARFNGRSQNATYLAYQLYGDPLITISRAT